MVVVSDIWKEAGLGTVVYLAAITNVSPELYEAAATDGAGPLRIFFQIMLPLAKAMLATVGLWLAVTSWNNF